MCDQKLCQLREMKSKSLLPTFEMRIAHQRPVLVSAVAALLLPKLALVLGAQYDNTSRSKTDAHTVTTASKHIV